MAGAQNTASSTAAAVRIAKLIGRVTKMLKSPRASGSEPSAIDRCLKAVDTGQAAVLNVRVTPL